MNTLPSFLWGVASSSHQVEGNNTNNDWWEWEHIPGKIKDGNISGDVVDHYNRFEEDFDHAKKMGCRMVRISFEWSRIMPKPNEVDKDAVAHYRAVLQALAERDMRAMVTLHHFTNPLWVSHNGGWENPDTVKSFAQYADIVAKELGKDIDYFVTINEPMVYLVLGYSRDWWPPGAKSILRARKAYKNLVAGHRAAAEAIRAHHPDAKIGIAKHITAFRPFSRNPLHRAVSAVSSWFFNDRFLRAIIGTVDFMGVNYYFSDTKRFCLNPSASFACNVPWTGTKTDLGWPIDPDGFSEALHHVSRYRLPIIVTENGLADETDSKRGDYIKKYTDAMLQARKDGIPIIGYLHWTLTDTFEWHDGFGPKFGLIEVNRTTQKRTPRPSSRVYSEIIKNNP